MPESGGVSKRGATAVLIAGLVGLWPILFILVIWALMNWGWSEGEFSLAPRDVTRNRVSLAVGIIATLLLDVGAVIFGIRSFVRRVAARGRALAGVIMAAVSALIIVSVFVFIGTRIGFGVMFGARGSDELTLEQRVEKCRQNQEEIAIMLGPDMWLYDHPEAKPEELKELDLSPQGDLIEPEDGPAYATDPAILDCPADDDPDDVDYAVDITPQGEVKVRCVDPAGIREGHNP
jgi:hypothetical protein